MFLRGDKVWSRIGTQHPPRSHHVGAKAIHGQREDVRLRISRAGIRPLAEDEVGMGQVRDENV